MTNESPIPNYISAVMEALARSGVPRPGTVTPVVVAHDDWCPIFEGRACSCSPEVTIPTVSNPTDGGKK